VQRRQFVGVVGASLVGGIGLSTGASAGEPVCAGQRFEVFRDVRDRYRWRLYAANGKIIARSEDYTTLANCLHNIELIQNSALTPTSFESDCKN